MYPINPLIPAGDIDFGDKFLCPFWNSPLYSVQTETTHIFYDDKGNQLNSTSIIGDKHILCCRCKCDFTKYIKKESIFDVSYFSKFKYDIYNPFYK